MDTTESPRVPLDSNDTTASRSQSNTGTETREIRLASRPTGLPSAANFALEETKLPAPAGGQLLVRNLFMSVDPYMRTRMDDVASYVPPYRIGDPLDGGAIGEVVASVADDFAPGDVVRHQSGWREHALVPARHVRKVEQIPGLPLSLHLGALGIPGLTAFVGLLDIARFERGDSVFVSGAAGAVGGLVGQIARLKGAKRVIGSAGSPEKARYLCERLGFDAAFDYHDGALTQQLEAAAPDGIDVYFDNIGGDHLHAAIDCMNPHGRVALCGDISEYNQTTQPSGPSNLKLAIVRQLTLRGFIIGDHFGRFPDLFREMVPWLRSGDLVADETVVHGLDAAVDAFLGLFRGANTGKMIVQL